MFIGFGIDEKTNKMIERTAQTKEELNDLPFICDAQDEKQIKRYRHVIENNILHGEEPLGSY